MTSAKSAALLVVLCACSDSPSPPGDALIPDAPPDVDNGTCGALMRFTGEFVDWDSGTNFCGIFGASFQARGATQKSMTAPNGRFDLCVASDATVLVDITPPSQPSQCASSQLTYELPGIAVANKAVITAGGFWSGRSFVSDHMPAPAPTKAQVFVHINGTPREVSIEAMHGTAQARVNGTWGAGTSGSDVFFPDVDPGPGTTILTASNAIGTGPIPLEAGKMTSVSIILN